MSIKTNNAIIVALVVLLILGLVTLTLIMFPQGHKIICETTSGEWEYADAKSSQSEGYCYQTSMGEGELCYQNSDCEVECLVTNNQNEERDANGFFVGRCGKANAINCYRTLPSKTKERKDIKPGTCF